MRKASFYRDREFIFKGLAFKFRRICIISFFSFLIVLQAMESGKTISTAYFEGSVKCLCGLWLVPSKGI